MRNDLTHLVLISDRSGSMAECREESQNAINRMIEDQQKEQGECLFTLVQFDDVYEVVHDSVNIKDVQPYELVPRGMTALYDAVGKAINTVGQNLSDMKEEDRPALITVVICTDGLNNASKEFSQLKVANLIKQQKEQYSWKFVFLGVEIDAEAIASNLNIDADAAVQVARDKSDIAYELFSGKMSSSRSAVRKGASAQSVSLNYTDDEKAELS